MPFGAHRFATLVATLTLTFATSIGGAAQTTAPAAAAERTGRQLYEASCAACHATDGTGAPRSVVGFDTPIPDFTDCSFATPEADLDWFAIAHQGGTIRAFDRRMPAFGEALSGADLSKIIQHIRGFCSDGSWPRGELNLPRALVTEKAFPENEAVYTAAIATGSFGNEFLYERRLGARTQWEVVVPVDVQDSETAGWNRGLGDLALALKRVIHHSLEAGRILSIAAEVVFPTGKEQLGLGKGVTIFEPFVAFGQILPSDSFIQAQAGVELSSNRGTAPNETFWRAAYGRTFMQRGYGRSWTPMIEVLGTHEWDAGEGAHWDVVPQVQVSLSRRQHILLNAGVQIPVNDRSGRSSRFISYLLWDWFDGGFFDGWR